MYTGSLNIHEISRSGTSGIEKFDSTMLALFIGTCWTECGD